MPPLTPIMQVFRCEHNGIQWPLFSLPVYATKARLDMCQEEVSVYLQALLRGGSSHGEGNNSAGDLLGKHRKWKRSLFSPLAGAETQGMYNQAQLLVRLSVCLSVPQMSCASTTPIALSTPRRSASQWRYYSRTRACRNTTRSSPLSRQLPRFQTPLTSLISLYVFYPPTGN